MKHQWLSKFENRINVEFDRSDVLDTSSENSISNRFDQMDLITFMFVLNELFCDKARTVKMLTKLVLNMKKGAHLLVVESAGSFSELKVGSKELMVYKLLDQIPKLEIIEKIDSIWYRFNPTLSFPLPLNNMRYFARLYKKL